MTDKKPDWVEIDAFLLTLPSLSRPLIERHFRSDFSVEQKADNSPVTIADKSVETELRQAISAAFPDHAIIGEEQGSKQSLLFIEKKFKEYSNPSIKIIYDMANIYKRNKEFKKSISILFHQQPCNTNSLFVFSKNM